MKVSRIRAFAALIAAALTVLLPAPAVAAEEHRTFGLEPQWYMVPVAAQVRPEDRERPLFVRPARPDTRGLRRDTWYFVGFQFTVIGLLYIAPENVSGWTDEQKSDYSLKKWWDNVRSPTIDSDDAYLNYVLHPYWGGAYYVRAKERGFSDEQAFMYSTFLSALYEFGAEALFEQPSIQDLVITPVVGSAVGYYFMRVRENIARREFETGRLRTRDRWTLALTDPLGTINRQLDRWFGWEESAVSVYPYYVTREYDREAAGPGTDAATETEFGLRFRIAWR